MSDSQVPDWRAKSWNPTFLYTSVERLRRFLSLSATILGLGGLLSDAAWCVIKNGQLAAAVEQTKVSRRARENAFPEESLRTVLEVAHVRAEEVGIVAVARPLAEGAESTAQLDLRARFPKSEIVVVDHHLAHASSAFYPSGFENASVISVDRAGDYRSAVLYEGNGRLLTPVREMYFPDSLGDLYNRVTELLGFRARADEHKVQWLSASGHPRYMNVFSRILHPDGTGWPRFDRTYFDADQLTQGHFSKRFFEECDLRPDEPIAAEMRADLAASLQRAISETIIGMLGSAQNVCLAGGLGLNALLVHTLEDCFPAVFVQPAAGNAGTAIGAALRVWHQFCGEAATVPFDTLSLGPEYSPVQIKQVLENCKLNFQFLETEGKVLERAVRVLSDQKIIAWMQGRMEFGPRALGNRSILAVPLRSILDREFECIHQTSGRISKIRCLRARGSGRKILRSKFQFQLFSHRRTCSPGI
jgi:carbamoyltransferase